MKSIASILVCGVLGSLVSLSAQALPLVSTPANVAGPDVTLVAGGCGLGFHRGPWRLVTLHSLPLFLPSIQTSPQARRACMPAS